MGEVLRQAFLEDERRLLSAAEGMVEGRGAAAFVVAFARRAAGEALLLGLSDEAALTWAEQHGREIMLECVADLLRGS